MGGRGGSSGLFGGSAKLPALEGSEKQIAWAEDIRKNAFERLSKMEKDVLNFDKMAKENAYSAETNQVRIFREQMEHVINGAYNQFSSIYAGTTSKVDEKFAEIEKSYKSSYDKYAKGTQERKDAYKKARKNIKKEYSKWLIDEYKKVLKGKTSARWWIDHR